MLASPERREHFENSMLRKSLPELVTKMSITPRSKVLLEKPRVLSASQEMPRLLWKHKVHYHSQDVAAGPYPEPDESNQRLQSRFPTIHFILSSHLHLVLPRGLFLSDSPTKVLYEILVSPMRATCPSHLILHDLITLIAFCGGYNYEAPRYAVFWRSPPLHLS
jgi:hypothetical protein